MNNETVLGLSVRDKVILIIIPPILGALLGWFIPTIANWLIMIPFIPFEGVLEWISTLESHWVSVIASVVGVLAGICFTLYAFYETLKIIINDEEVKLNFKGDTQTLQRRDISAIYLENKHIVFLDPNRGELFRDHTDKKNDVLSYAFSQHGYPWTDRDPFEDQYQRWVAEHPDYSSHVNALLTARERALKNEESEEVKDLRKDLADLGVVVRDKGKHQYVRSVRKGEVR